MYLHYSEAGQRRDENHEGCDYSEAPVDWPDLVTASIGRLAHRLAALKNAASRRSSPLAMLTDRHHIFDLVQLWHLNTAILVLLSRDLCI